MKKVEYVDQKEEDVVIVNDDVALHDVEEEEVVIVDKDFVKHDGREEVVIVDENVVRHYVTEKENDIADENVVQYDAELYLVVNDDVFRMMMKRKTVTSMIVLRIQNP